MGNLAILRLEWARKAAPDMTWDRRRRRRNSSSSIALVLH